MSLSPAQTAYLTASAAVKAITSEVYARFPEPADDSEAVVDAWLDAQADLEEELGLFAATAAKSRAEDALLAWVESVIAPTAKVQGQIGTVAFVMSAVRAGNYKARVRMIDLALRLDGATC